MPLMLTVTRTLPPGWFRAPPSSLSASNVEGVLPPLL
jgi:hypothetical protein